MVGRLVEVILELVVHIGTQSNDEIRWVRGES
jgi:hypothetical protein